MGSPAFAVPSLNALIEARQQVVAVYCQPPRPAGRGRDERRTAVHDRASQLNIEVRTPRTLRDVEQQEQFRSLDADLAIVAAYGLILPKAILQSPRLGCINVHASLLPRWRGAAPIQRAILAGDDMTGITLMHMDEGLDTGPILLKLPVRINRRNAGELTDILAEIGGQALSRFVAGPDQFPPAAQLPEGATYASKIDKAEAELDFSLDALAVERQVRAFNPVPGAWLEYASERIKILAANVVSGEGPPGMVGDDFTIACADRAIQPSLVQRAGRKPMSVEEFLRGFPIPKGALLDRAGRSAA